MKFTGDPAVGVPDSAGPRKGLGPGSPDAVVVAVGYRTVLVTYPSVNIPTCGPWIGGGDTSGSSLLPSTPEVYSIQVKSRSSGRGWCTEHADMSGWSGHPPS